MSELALPRSETGEHALGARLLSDELLAKLVGRGSSHAFAVIYERHHQALYRYCRSILRDEHDAQDALQSTMTQAYAALCGKERDVSLRAWLFRIAHNESITILRKRTRELDVEEMSPLAGGEPEAVLEGRGRLKQLVADLLELPERQRAALVMRELSGLNIEEIAGALTISPAAAKQALFEARNSLRELSEGREMDCENVCHAISAHDRRVLRGRRIRAHLRACERCRNFQTAISAREADLRALAPAMPAPAAIAILARLLGGGHWGGAAGGGGAGVAGGSSPALLAHVGGSLLVKGAAGMAIVAVAAAGTVSLTAVSGPRRSTQTAPLGVGKSSVAAGSVLGGAQTQSATSAHNGANATGASHGLHASRPGSRTGGGAAAAQTPVAQSGHSHESREPGGGAERTSHGHAHQAGEKHAPGQAGQGAHAGRERHGSAPRSRGHSHGSTHGSTHGGLGKPTTHRPAGKGAHGGGTGTSAPKLHAPATPTQGEGETGQPASTGTGNAHVKNGKATSKSAVTPGGK
ncbi:MAG TPA: sigma-70 family RNA polymerase sigma factor [Solirubrobacteraceae bacterium]|jgi:RNA polymerase sigma factor (sigma-70 family)|nr:sigma-70 family RNA polymerase sigma factor [Solirubrobacteraceae bacterium]